MRRSAFGLSVAALSGVSILAGMPSHAHAAMIGINFDGGGATGSELAAADSAGVTAVAQQYWNNAGGNSGSLLNPNDSTEQAVTGLHVSWVSSYTYGSGSVDGFSSSTGDGELFNTYLSFASSGGTGDSVTVTGIPYSSYNVFVYLTSNTTYNSNGGVFLKNVATESGGLNTTEYYFHATSSGSYVQATQTTETLGNPIVQNGSTQFANANYAEFTGNSEDSFVVHVDSSSYNENEGIAGIQIVDTSVPEPASLGIVLVCASVLLRRRRASCYK